MDGAPPPEEDFTSLPIAERLEHKNWKARVSGYEALNKLFQSTASDSDPAFRPYMSHPESLKKMILDSNAVAQEKALEAVVSFVKYSGENAARTRDSVIPALVEKCVGSTRAGTRNQSLELVLQYIEMCNTGADIVIDLLQGLSAKQPKTVLGTVTALKESIRCFGVNIVPSPPILKSLPKMFSHTDKSVRAEASNLTILLYRAMGPAVETWLADLKPVQMKELSEMFATLEKDGQGKGTLKPERQTREQQRQVHSSEVLATEEGNSTIIAAPPDPRMFAEEIDITPRLPSQLYDALSSSKWKERKEALDDLQNILKQTQRIKDCAEIGALVKALAARMGDANINCVITASACVESLAKGMMDNFSRYKDSILRPMLERLKERKQSVIDALAAALDAVFCTTTFADTADDIITTLQSKNPQVKEHALRFLVRCLSTTTVPPTGPQIKPLSEGLVVLLDDSHEAARAEAAIALGTLMKIIGERPLNAVLEPVAELKKAKVKEAFQQASVKCKAGGVPASKPVTGAAAHSSPPETRTPISPKPQSRPANGIKDSKPGNEKATNPSSRGPPQRLLNVKKATADSNQKGPPTATGTSKKPPAVPASKSASKSGPGAPATAASEPVKFKYSSEEAESLAAELIPAGIVAGISDSNWKTRLATLEELQVWLEDRLPSMESEVLIRFLAKRCWGEKNFQVSTKVYGVLTQIAEQCPNFGRPGGALAIPHLAEKLGDMKLKRPAGDTLLLFAEKTSLAFVLPQVYETIEKQKAPKVVADSIIWIDQAVVAFGVMGLSLRSLVEFLKTGLKNSNAAVRASATKALVTVKLFAGAGIKDLLEDLNPQLLATIQQEFDRVEGTHPPEPSRFSALDRHGSDNAASGTQALLNPLDELFPRVDLERLVSGTSIIQNSKSDNWKVRKEALEALVAILDVGSNKRLKTTMGDLSQVLKARVVDTNKACQLLALDALTKVAAGMNKPFEKHVKLFILPVASVLADQKANIRSAALNTMSEMATACEGLDHFIPSIGTALEAQNPLQRSSLLIWLSEWLQTHTTSSHFDTTPWIRPTLSCLEDRSSDVRKGAQTLLPFIISSVGYGKVVSETNSLKPASRSSVVTLLSTLKPKDTDARAASPGPSEEMKSRPASPAISQIGTGTVSGKSTGLRGRKIGPPLIKKADQGSTEAARMRAPATGVPKNINSNRTHGITSTSAPKSEPFAPQCPFIGSNPDAKKTRLSKDVSRWIIDGAPVRKDLLDVLRQQMEAHASSELLHLLFSSDQTTSVNDYVAGMTMMANCYSQILTDVPKAALESTKSILIANSDFPLRYACIKVHESQPNLISKGLDVIEAVIRFFRYVDFRVNDSEALCFIPTMIHKLGDARETSRIRVQQVLQLLPSVYASSRIFSLYLEHGLHSKVAKTRQGSLDELSTILKRTGDAACDPARSLPVIGAMISDKDPNVRKSALNALSEAYNLMGDKLWMAVGSLNAKDKTQLEERLRRSPGLQTQAEQSSGNPSGSQLTPRKQGATVNIRSMSPSKPLPRSASPALLQPRYLHKETALPTLSAKPSTSAIGFKRSHLPSRLARPPSRQTVGRQRADDAATDREARDIEAAGNVTHPDLIAPAELELVDTRITSGHDNGGGKDSDVSTIISSILSNDTTRSVEALKRIQKILEPPTDGGSHFQELTVHAEGLIETITVQVTHVFNHVDDLMDPASFRLAKHLMQTLHSFFTHSALAEALAVDNITSLLEELTLRLLQTDESVDTNIKEISRFINLILLKIFATARRISVFRALFSLLLKIVKPFPASRTQPDAQEAKVAELVLKCIWKLARNIPSDLDKQLLDPTEMFPAIEHTLQSIPPNDWRARSTNKVPCGDMPLRTIKVIIQHIVAKHGDHVYDYLSGAFDDPSATIVYPYVYRILNSTRGDNPGPSYLTALPSSSSSSTLEHAPTPSRPTSEISQYSEKRNSSSPGGLHRNSTPSMNGVQMIAPAPADDDPDTQLLQIINHISSETTPALHKEGIAELHQFLKAYPHKKGKVEKLLEATGPAFRKYLARALASRAAEDEEREAAVADTLSRLEAVRRGPTSPVGLSPSPRRSSGASDIAENADKLSRLHDIFRYRASGSSVQIPENPPGEKVNGS